MKKRILILKACGSSDEPHECNGICEQAQLYGIESVCKCVKDNEDLESILYSLGLFDYVYLSAHGNAEGFASEDGKVNMSWQKNICRLASNWQAGFRHSNPPRPEALQARSIISSRYFSCLFSSMTGGFFTFLNNLPLSTTV